MTGYTHGARLKHDTHNALCTVWTQHKRTYDGSIGTGDRKGDSHDIAAIRPCLRRLTNARASTMIKRIMLGIINRNSSLNDSAASRVICQIRHPGSSAWHGGACGRGSLAPAALRWRSAAVPQEQGILGTPELLPSQHTALHERRQRLELRHQGGTAIGAAGGGDGRSC